MYRIFKYHVHILGDLASVCIRTCSAREQHNVSKGLLNAQEVKKLNELMQVYRHGSVRKAKAMQVAVMRGLIPALNAAS